MNADRTGVMSILYLNISKNTQMVQEVGSDLRSFVFLL